MPYAFCYCIDYEPISAYFTLIAAYLRLSNTTLTQVVHHDSVTRHPIAWRLPYVCGIPLKKSADQDMRRASALVNNPSVTASVSTGTPLPANYLDLYGLSKPPFGGSPDDGAYILFGSHRRIFEQLVEHMLNGSGLALLQGEEGAGKSGMLAAAQNVAAGSALRLVRVNRPQLGRLDLQQLIAAILGPPANAFPTEEDFALATGQFLAAPRMVLLIEDVELVPTSSLRALLAMLRQIPASPGGSAMVLTTTTDLQADPEKGELIQIASLARTIFRLPRLGPAEVRQYIERSLWVAGGTTRRLIAPDALRLIVAHSAGLPGSINRLMEATFTAGFARGDALITGKTVVAALGPTRGQKRDNRPRRRGFPGTTPQAVAVGLLLIGFAAFLYQGLNGAFRGSRAPALQTAPFIMPPMPAPPDRGAAQPMTPPATDRPAGPASAGSTASLSPSLVAALMKRGDQALGLGDFAAARLFFQRAAEAGNAQAATAMGKTYDPFFAAAGSVEPDRADLARAAEWYGKAITLGDPQANDLARRLQARTVGPKR